MKKNAYSLMFITTAACLLPLILSILFYNELPERVAIHWDITGTPDNFAPKAFAAFALPVFIALLNVYINLKLINGRQPPHGMHLLLHWFSPVMSLVLIPITLFAAMGRDIPIATICVAVTGLFFVAFGNYLPKCRQNQHIGIRLPWTLNDADNWNKTHRLAGPLFMLFGAVLIAQAFAKPDNAWISYASLLIAPMISLPIAYSYILHKRKEAAQ